MSSRNTLAARFGSIAISSSRSIIPMRSTTMLASSAATRICVTSPYALDAIKGQDKVARGPSDPLYRWPLKVPPLRKQQYERLKAAHSA